MRLSNHASNNILQYQTPLLAALWLDSENLEFIMWQNRNSPIWDFSLLFILAWCLECDTSQHGITTLLCFDILRIQRVISMTKLKTRFPNHIYMFTCSFNPAILINYWLTNGSWIGLPREAPFYRVLIRHVLTFTCLYTLLFCNNVHFSNWAWTVLIFWAVSAWKCSYGCS